MSKELYRNLKETVLALSKSPFEHDRKHEKGNIHTVSFKLTKQYYDELTKYFIEHGYHDKSEGFRSLCYDKLNSICNERKTFNHVELIMLIPKTIDIYKLNMESKVISVINTRDDFINNYQYDKGFTGEYKLIYDLKSFDVEHFPMDILSNTKESKVYFDNSIVPKDSLRTFPLLFKAFKLSFDDDFYFVRFPLNNYLDVKRKGQFQHPLNDNVHEGVYCFSDALNEVYLFSSIKWSYSVEHGLIDFDVVFLSEFEFFEKIVGMDDDKLVGAYEGIYEYKKEFLLNLKRSYSMLLDRIDNVLDDL